MEKNDYDVFEIWIHAIFTCGVVNNYEPLDYYIIIIYFIKGLHTFYDVLYRYLDIIEYYNHYIWTTTHLIITLKTITLLWSLLYILWKVAFALTFKRVQDSKKVKQKERSSL